MIYYAKMKKKHTTSGFIREKYVVLFSTTVYQIMWCVNLPWNAVNRFLNVGMLNKRDGMEGYWIFMGGLEAEVLMVSDMRTNQAHLE